MRRRSVVEVETLLHTQSADAFRLRLVEQVASMHEEVRLVDFRLHLEAECHLYDPMRDHSQEKASVTRDSLTIEDVARHRRADLDHLLTTLAEQISPLVARPRPFIQVV